MTLIELLVSLVLLGFVVTIMSGAFHQVAQVVRVAENVNGAFQPQWVRLHALTDLVANLALPEDDLQPFEGNSDGFRGFSLSLPQGDWGNVQPFTVKLLPAQQGGGSELAVTGADDKPMVVAAWDTPMVLEYLAVDGSVQSSWPPFGKTADRMPSGVMVRSASGAQQVQLVAPYAGARNPDPNSSSAAVNAMEQLFGVKMPASGAPGVQQPSASPAPNPASNGNSAIGDLFGVPLK